MIILDAIPFQPDLPALLAHLHIREGSAHAHDFAALLESAQEIARPKALYRPAFIDERGADFVCVEGVRLSSRVLAVNLAETGRVFPFVATCGVELEAWASGFADLLERFWADAIQEAALYAALGALERHQDKTFALGHTGRMNPGSLEDWPLTQQRELFALLPETEAAIGVRLTASCLMLPAKSVSGLRFPLSATFESCQLCPREICPNRRAPYDPHLYAQKYAGG
jgi:hypothetical protein